MWGVYLFSNYIMNTNNTILTIVVIILIVLGLFVFTTPKINDVDQDQDVALENSATPEVTLFPEGKPLETSTPTAAPEPHPRGRPP